MRWKLKVTIIIMIFILGLLNTNPVLGAFESYDTKTFSGKGNITAQPEPPVPSNFTLYDTLYFSGKLDSEGLGSPAVRVNGSAGVEEMNATLFGYVLYNLSNDTTCWFQLDKETSTFATLDVNESVGVQPQNTNFSSNITNLENGTFYYFRTAINNTNGWNTSTNMKYFLTKPQPAYGMSISPIADGFNISWTQGDGSNVSYLVVNETHVPSDRGDGTYLDPGTNDYYHHTGLTPATTYYYRVWEYTSRTPPTFATIYQWSDGNTNSSSMYQGQQPVLKYPNPANESMYVSGSITTWNITIESPTGTQFNWTIQGEADIGNNASTNCLNGSYFMNVTGNLTENSNYTVWVNSTQINNDNWTNETFWFTTGQFNFTVYHTLSFGSKLDLQGTDPIISNEQPTNGSSEIELYPWLNITISDPQSDTLNVTWTTNATGSWIQYNTTVASGTTVRQRATFVNTSETEYWWTVDVNDSQGETKNATYYFSTDSYTWGDWSSWWEFNYTCCGPTSFSANTYNETVINLTWLLCGASADTNHLVVNESGWNSYPLTPTNGTIIYNGTNASYNHTDLSSLTSYYYTIWGYNETNNNYSIINETASATTQGDIDSYGPYPANQSIGISRPPANISVWLNGSNVDVYYGFYNMTPSTNTTAWFKTWTSTNNGHHEESNTNLTARGNDFLWGGTQYQWWVNITDGTNWVNKSYWYNTTGSRYDVTNSGDVVSTDATVTWNNRAGEGTYDGIYDVDYSGDITATDASYVWNNRT